MPLGDEGAGESWGKLTISVREKGVLEENCTK